MGEKEGRSVGAGGGSGEDSVDSIFSAAVKNQVFAQKKVLQANYAPETIPHRQEQTEAVASILAPALRGEKVSNLFVYGNTGTGKTLTVQHVGQRMVDKAGEVEGTPVKFVYVNCKLRQVADTEYRMVAEMIKTLGGSVPATGLPTQEVYNKFVELIDDQEQIVILVLDEIDQAVQKISDTFIYTLTRLNSELKKAQISIVGISNSLTFMDDIDPRVRSSLGEEELVFPPYHALQLQDILSERAADAFQDGVLSDGVIAKCAAFAAREHGDARRALDLLRVAGELSEREHASGVKESHIDQANEKIEKDKMLAIIESEPRQFQLVLGAIFSLDERGGAQGRLVKGEQPGIFTGDVYLAYQELCEKAGTEVLTQRRVSDILNEFDMLGIINARVISKGRHGRTREIKLMLSSGIKDQAKEIVSESLGG